jgi:hypothetical protein
MRLSRWQGTLAVTLIVGLLHTGRGAEPAVAGSAAGTLSSRELESLWADLAGDDARRAYGAICDLAASPRQAVPFLRERWRPAAKLDLRRVARLLADLDADEFRVREKAHAELAKLGESAEPALRQALKGKPSLEVRRRVERLLKRLEPWRVIQGGEALRWLRAIQVLERIATAEAQQLLRLLARKAATDGLRREAAASLQRLNQGPPATAGSRGGRR